MMIGRESYALRLAAAVRSIIDNLGADRVLELTIVEEGLSESSRRRLLESWDLSRTTVRWLGPTAGGRVRLPDVPGLTPVYLARLFCASYVPDEWTRLIALDPDVLVLTDLGRLWDEPMNGHPVLGTRDPFVPTIGHPDGVGAWRRAGLDPGATYMSAAVMLLDLARWRRDETSRTAESFIAAHATSIRFGDQDVLNAMFAGRWGELDPRWQVHPRILTQPRLARTYLDPVRLDTLRRDPWVYHFGGRLKPWVYRANQAADRAFFEYLDRTAWRGWRPRPGLRNWAYRVYDSPLRGWIHPVEIRASAALRAVGRLARRVRQAEVPASSVP